MVRKIQKNKSKTDILYCSFCGKSQHEIRKLIAGPTVFICDECTELCEDIIWEDNGDRFIVKVRLPATSGFDDVLYSAVSQLVGEQFPDIDFRYECRTVDASSVFDASSNVGVFSAAKVFGSAVGNPEANQNYTSLRHDLTKALQKLSVANTKFVHANEKAKAISAELVSLKAEYLEHLRILNPKPQRASLDLRVVMFLDVSGFSTMDFERRHDIVDMLRGMTPTLLSGKGAHEVNMWGDAIVANFSDVNQSIESAIRFIRHLGVEGLDVRIGMAWGEVRINFNPAIGKRDIDGDVVNYAARLEPLAPKGGVLLSNEFGGLDIDPNLAELIPTTVEVKKAFGSHEVGEMLPAYILKVLRN